MANSVLESMQTQPAQPPSGRIAHLSNGQIVHLSSGQIAHLPICIINLYYQ
ncbi:MAG: hypothetical protein LBK82_11670 [Planctomycetaceae bacterium]|nr:hypothetical protein [Planctomycetaceae bacterium]